MIRTLRYSRAWFDRISTVALHRRRHRINNRAQIAILAEHPRAGVWRAVGCIYERELVARGEPILTSRDVGLFASAFAASSAPDEPAVDAPDYRTYQHGRLILAPFGDGLHEVFSVGEVD